MGQEYNNIALSTHELNRVSDIVDNADEALNALENIREEARELCRKLQLLMDDELSSVQAGAEDLEKDLKELVEVLVQELLEEHLQPSTLASRQSDSNSDKVISDEFCDAYIIGYKDAIDMILGKILDILS